MKAILLAAGKGQRLKGLLDNIPKPMVEIAGKPILQHNLEWLENFSITDIYINIHHLPDVIKSHFGDGSKWKVRITYSYESNLLGTAGAVKKIARDYWGNNNDEPFLVVYGDNLISDFDLNRIVEFHKAKRGIGTICLYHKPEEIAKSGVAVLDKQCRIVKFIEKPAPGEVSTALINTGVYMLEAAIFEYIPEDCCCDFGKDVFVSVLDAGENLFGLTLSANLIAVDTPQLFEKNISSRFNK